jgi:tetratricopeptide (TPR) repeat protein
MGDREGEADASSRLAAIAGRLFQVEEARRHYARAAALYEQVGKRQGQAAVMLNAGMLAGNLGRYGDAEDMFQQAEDLFRSMDDRRGMATAVLNRSAMAIYQQHFATAEEMALRSLELARVIGNPLVEAAALGNVGDAALNLGALDLAIRHLEEALAVRRRLGLPPDESAGDLSLLTLAYLRAGRLQEARRKAEELLEMYGQAGESLPHPQQVLWTVAQVLHAAGDTQRSAQLLRQAHRLLRDKAAAIPDPESRAAFLDLPFNRDLLATGDDRRRPPPTDETGRPAPSAASGQAPAALPPQ